jgi:hypothetical protein
MFYHVSGVSGPRLESASQHISFLGHLDQK